MNWSTNSIHFYLVIEVTLTSGLIGYYDYDHGFVADINKATWFQNEKQIQEVGPVLPPDSASHEFVMIEVNDSNQAILSINKKSSII